MAFRDYFKGMKGAYEDTRSRFWRTLPILFITTATILFYLPSLWYGFRFDDVPNIRMHFPIRTENFFSLFLTGPRWISCWLNTIYFKFFGFNPLVYRIGGLLTHISIILLIYFLTKRLLTKHYKTNKSVTPKNIGLVAAFAAALFALHPVQTQTVTYIIQSQLEGLATFFALAVCMVYVRMRESSDPIFKKLWAIGLFALLFLGSGTKEIFIVTPILLALIEWFFLSEASWKKFKQALLFLVILLITVIALYAYFQTVGYILQALRLDAYKLSGPGNLITENYQTKITPWRFMISSFQVILHYLWMYIWPGGISVDYNWRLASGFFSATCLAPLMVLLILFLILWRTNQRNPRSLVVFGFLWFAVSTLPRASFVPSQELVADYKVYLGSYGLLLIFASFLAGLTNFISEKTEKPGPSALLALIILMLPLGLASHQRNLVWSSEKALWQDVIRKSPKARAFNNFGREIAETGAYDDAIKFFRKAIDMDPAYPDPYNNAGLILGFAGKTKDAIDYIGKAVAIAPHMSRYKNNLGTLLIGEDPENAITILNDAIKLDPHYGKAYLNLGKAHERLGHMDDAYTCFKKACTEADMDNVHGLRELGLFCARAKKYPEAIQILSKTTRQLPDIESFIMLGDVLSLSGKHDEAMQMYNAAKTISPNIMQRTYKIMQGTRADTGNQKIDSARATASQVNNLIMELPLKVAIATLRAGKTAEAVELLKAILGSNAPTKQKAEAEGLLKQVAQGAEQAHKQALQQQEAAPEK